MSFPQGVRGDLRGKIPGLLLHLLISILISQIILSPYLASAKEAGPLLPMQVTLGEAGLLDIEVNVGGAIVTIDQQKKGKAPIRDIELSPGTHHVSVTKKGYVPWTSDLVIEPGEHSVIAVVLILVDKTKEGQAPPPAATAPDTEKQKIDLGLSTGKPEAPQKPIYKRWWFWTLVVLAAGGAAAAAGDHTFTITYYDPSGLTIAQASTTGDVSAGTNTNVSISQSQVNTAFDDDKDGSTNLVEINSGSNPKDPGSMPTAPSAPVGVTATAGNSQVVISWNAVTGATSYNIYWATTSGVTKTTGIKILSATSPYTHTPLTNNTTYYYVVTAVNTKGESSESAQVSATPTASPNTLTLTVAKSGTGTGTVTSSPAGIDCGADCSEPYNSGVSVVLTATPAAGSSFAGWSGGGCTGTAPCAVTMSAATTVTATFNISDTTALIVSSTNPVNLAKSVAVNTLITANFSELMDATTITSATFTLTSAAGPVTGSVSYTGNTATFTPSSNLAFLTNYTATITTGVKDLAGNPMALNFTWSFTTSAGPASFGPVTFFAVGTTPASIAIGDLNGDGKLDLAVANAGSNTVSILLNQPASAPAKPTILAEPGGEQAASSKDASHSAFGCGGIDLHGNGPSGPSDMGGLGSLLAIMSLPFILRLWRRIFPSPSPLPNGERI